MIEIQLTGGLGDAFIVLHESTAYEALESMPPGERAVVYIISHNPFVGEIFKWHPKVDRISVVRAKHFFVEYADVRQRRAAGLPDRFSSAHPPRPRGPIRFYPSPDDFQALDREIPRSPFLAVAPTASGMEIENRNIPPEIIRSAVRAAHRRGIPVVLLGRTYQGPHAPKSWTRPTEPGMIDLVDRLSVPGTAEVVKRARAVFSCHSCLLILSWYERKPVFAVYPPKYMQHDFLSNSPFGFGRDYPESVHMLFERYRTETFEAFLEKNFGGPQR